MSKITQCDLSAGIAKVDFEALQKTAAYAVYNLRQNINNYSSKLDNDLLEKNHTGSKLNAKWLADEAEKLAIATEVYTTLMEADTRETLEIVNKNNPKKEQNNNNFTG